MAVMTYREALNLATRKRFAAKSLIVREGATSTEITIAPPKASAQAAPTSLARS